METLAFISMDASGRHPGIWKMHAVLAFCSAVIAFPFPLATFWGGLRFRRRSDGSRRTGGLVGLQFLWQAGLQQVFN